MKLISLNVYGGRIREPLFEFLKYQKDVDIFCFQEVYHNAPDQLFALKGTPDFNLFSSLKNALTNHNAFFRPSIFGCFGIALFIKKGIEVVAENSFPIFENPNYIRGQGNHTRVLQWADCVAQDKEYHIAHFHGHWTKDGKGDSPERLKQSRIVKKFIDTINKPKILCGDFNLRPDTKSLAILEEGMIDLIKTYNIISTRPRSYDKGERYADYMLVSSDIQIIDFKVLPDEVSDHSPLYLNFS